jgi:restriction system protein
LACGSRLGARDGGVGVRAVRKDDVGEFLYLIECKRYAQDHPVGVHLVRSLHGITRTAKASVDILVTTSTFTREAQEFQQTVPYQLSLRDYIDLVSWLERYK